MVQTERETGALRGQFARQAAVQASAAAQAESARAQAEQLSRKLAAAREIAVRVDILRSAHCSKRCIIT